MRRRGQGTAFQKQGTDLWTIQYYANGRRVRESTHTRNRNEAVKILNQRLTAAADGKLIGSEINRTTLDVLLLGLENDYKANGRRSLDRVQQAAAHLREFFGGKRKARAISAAGITAYQAHRLGERAAASTTNYECAMLRRALRLGARAGLVAARPEVDMLHVDNARKGFFEAEEFQAVLRHLHDNLKPVAETMFITGWRTSELLSRQWRHVDLDAGWLRLDPGESKNGEGREFPMTIRLRALLQQQRERVRDLERTSGRIVPWVFVRDNGSQVRDFRYAWKKVCRAAGVPGRLVHDFRRTAVRNLERAGVPRSAAMKLTGHKTEAVYRRYAITDSAMLQEAALKLDQFHAAEWNSPNSAPIRPQSGER
jgi:integrase